MSDASSIFFSRMFFDIIREKSFILAPLYTFTANYSILDYFNILFILDLNSELRNFKLYDQKLLFKGFVL